MARLIQSCLLLALCQLCLGQFVGVGKVPVFLRNQQNNKCVTAHGGGSEDGAAIDQWDCVNAANQQWVFNFAGFGPTGMPYLTINPMNSGKCMTVHGGGVETGAIIDQWTCVTGTNPSLNQKWYIQGSVNYPGFLNFVNVNSNKCLTVHGGGDENGAYCDQWDCIDSHNQAFQVTFQ